ncbi:D-alanyl-D-alanine carboxypeptidase family protein [Lachnoclostridium sp. Marseille-P6806]|uniref:D-alanyl-D-alanine carboxypeptidase family protein n=1 Tax=Lachnoclostridium sp. Marseille-P6806 TaxID=2364793 RepID=UPI001030367F|nr:D-alanyl-D-alanine carboxypeptidase family protein [Lachnoclostridium sp. Marseille-P6806]
MRRPLFSAPARLPILTPVFVLFSVLFLVLLPALLFPQRVSAAAVQEGEVILSASGARDYATEAEARKALPIRSNAAEGWPQGPEISAEGACLLDADTGVVLYDKNMDEPLYPASTTKLLTCLIAAEELSLSDTVMITASCLASVPPGSSCIGMDAGERITVEEALYGILVGSANEVSNAVAEKVAGSTEAFVRRMNERAKELGCLHTHFVTTNGLHDENHYTTAYDLAKIAQAFFENDVCARIGNTPRYHFEATAEQPDDFWLNNKHELITGALPYTGILGGKTGYTDAARQTLVTACEQNGMTLIAVVMKCESPSQFTETAALFDYGFHNFSHVNIADSETLFRTPEPAFLSSGSSPLGNASPLFRLSPDRVAVLPVRSSASDLTAEISYAEAQNGRVCGVVSCYFHSVFVGSAELLLLEPDESAGEYLSFPEAPSAEELSLFQRGRAAARRLLLHFVHRSSAGTVYIDGRSLVFAFSGLSALLFLLILLISYIRSYTRPGRIRRRRWKRNENADSIGGYRRFRRTDSF